MSNDSIKEHYNQEVPQESGGNYEKYRWFSSADRKVGYDSTKTTIESGLISLIKKSPRSIIEFGPGPGTWTKVLLNSWPNSNFDLVDISEAMLNQVRSELGEAKIRLFETDLAQFDPDQTYDLVFSSRMIEYLEDKEVLGQKLAQVLANGGTGFIITKTPHPWFNFWRGRVVPERHQRQISPARLSKLLKKYGFIIEKFYVATVSVPVFHSPTLNKIVFRVLRHLPFNPLTALVSESYAVRFKKKKVVELFGLPGSGKSSWARKLSQRGFSLIKVNNRLELIWLNLIFLFNHPIIFNKLFWLIVREKRGPAGLLRSKLINLLGQSNAKWVKAKRVDLAVVDQGHWQNCLSLFEHPATLLEMETLAKFLPRPDELMIVEAEPNHRSSRVFGRGYHARESFGEDYARSWRQVTEANYQTFKSILPKLSALNYSIVQS